MIICIYKKFFSKSGEEFQLCGAGIFKASTVKIAKSIIKDWNESGSRKNESNCRWKYEVMETKQATLIEMDDKDILYVR